MVAGHHRCDGWRSGATHGCDRGPAGLRGEPILSRPLVVPWWIISVRPLGPPARRSWRSMTLGRTKPCPVLLPHSPPPLPLTSLPSLTRPTRRAISHGKTCSRAPSQPCGTSPPLPRHARGITPDDGDGDDEHPHTRKRTKIQGVITAYIDLGVREGLLQMHEGEGSWAARTRLAELSDPNVDHTWLWRLNPRHGMLTSTLTRSAFAWAVLAPRNPSLAPPATLAFWTPGAAHASCCALGEATHGHNAISSLIHAAAQQCDHTAEMEVPGLIPGTDSRPPDVLTSALGNAYTDCTGRVHLFPARLGGWHRLHPDQGGGQTRTLWPPPACPSSPEHLLHTHRVECLWATSPRHVDRFELSQ